MEENQSTEQKIENQNKRTVAAYKVDYVVERFHKVQKKAKKLGLPELSLQIGEYREVYYNSFQEGCIVPVSELVCDIEIIGAMPKIEGYIFICKIEHTRNNATGEKLKNMVKGMVDNLPLEYHDLHSNCEHCKTKRFRKETYMIERTEDGSRLQVGSECLKNYMSLKTVAWILFAGEIGNVFEGEPAVKRVPRYVHTNQFVAAAIVYSKKYGFRSKAAVQYTQNYSTATLAWENFHPVKDQYGKLVSEYVPVSDEDIKDAEEIMQKVRTTEAHSSFQINLQTILNQPFIFQKDAGMLAVVAKIYMEEQGQKAEAAARKTRKNEHFGTVGSRVEVVVTIRDRKEFDNEFGTSWLLVMIEDGTGHTFKTFTSNPQQLFVGDRAIIKGTIKSHEVYKDFKSTMLSRIKVQEYIKSPKAETTSA